MIACFGVFVFWIAERESFINFAGEGCHASLDSEPTWVPSPRAVPTLPYIYSILHIAVRRNGSRLV